MVRFFEIWFSVGDKRQNQPKLKKRKFFSVGWKKEYQRKKLLWQDSGATYDIKNALSSPERYLKGNGIQCSK